MHNNNQNLSANKKNQRFSNILVSGFKGNYFFKRREPPYMSRESLDKFERNSILTD